MTGSALLFLWCLGTALEAMFVVCSVARKSFLKYLFLNLYFLVSILTSVSRYLILRSYGVSSDEYMRCYYYTDAVLTLTLFLAIISLFHHVFGELRFAKYVRTSAVLLLLGTAGFSYAVVAGTEEKLSSGTLAYELSQNLYFVGLVLTYILWGAVLKLRETRTRLVQFVLALGLYFSAHAALYALMNMGERNQMLGYITPLLGCLLPLALTVTLIRYTEDARLAPSQLVAVPR